MTYITRTDFQEKIKWPSCGFIWSAEMRFNDRMWNQSMLRLLKMDISVAVKGLMLKADKGSSVVTYF